MPVATIRWALFCAMAMVLPAAAETPDRAALYLTEADHAEWQAIGRVNSAGYKSTRICSGALVAPDLVLTAAHCVPDTLAPSEFVFAAGWFRDSKLAVRRGADVIRAPMTMTTAPAEMRAFLSDIALLRLDGPITEVPPLPIGGEADSSAYAYIGYSGARRYGLSGRTDCGAVPAGIEGLIVTDCAVIGGHSGAPVMRQGDGGWEVVAVMVAGRRTPPIRSLAIPIPARFLELIEGAL